MRVNNNDNIVVRSPCHVAAPDTLRHDGDPDVTTQPAWLSSQLSQHAHETAIILRGSSLETIHCINNADDDAGVNIRILSCTPLLAQDRPRGLQ